MNLVWKDTGGSRDGFPDFNFCFRFRYLVDSPKLLFFEESEFGDLSELSEIVFLCFEVSQVSEKFNFPKKKRSKVASVIL
jgi:hypothetical protein